MQTQQAYQVLVKREQCPNGFIIAVVGSSQQDAIDKTRQFARDWGYDDFISASEPASNR